MREVRDEYSAKFPLSFGWADRASHCLAGGSTHDAWRLDPFPLFSHRAQGPHKWTAEGHCLIDFWMGHGALLCGHGFGPVADAIRDAVEKGLHFGGPHPLQVEW